MESSFSNNLVPKHAVASDAEVSELLAKFNKPVSCLPVIYSEDPALEKLSAKEGDVIRIERKSPVTGKVEQYYRRVVEE